MEKMYPPVVNSPKTELSELITDTQTEITVANASVLLQGEGIAVLGNGDVAETITYTSVEDNVLKGCVRGFEGVARAWPVGTRVARNFTAADWRAAINNIQALHEDSDVEVRKTVTLQPGVQIVKADRQAAFSLTGLKGRMVIDYDGQKGIFGVRNPYAIRYGENLLPSFYEWSNKEGTPTMTEAYSIVVSSVNKIIQAIVPVVPGQTYTLSVQSGSATGRVFVYNTQGAAALADKSGSGLITVTFTIPTGVKFVEVRLLGTDSSNVTLSNPMLNIGSIARPFKPREDSMLALQTDLYADPVSGANADTVFERDGQYFKSKKWQGLTLDGNRTWVNGEAGLTAGLKQVKVAGLATGAVAGSGIGVKFDGKLLPQGATGSTPDTNAVTAAGDIYASIPIADSGWGDSYTPTADEIKAYFNGWKMYDTSAGSTIAPYNRTDGQSKGWVRRRLSDGAFVDGVGTLPTVQAPEYTPYKLIYQLATPTVEPIVSEGQLSFIEGDNQVEVGTGIVLREKATPFGAYINAINAAGGTSNLKNKTTRILAVYKSGMRDASWSLRSNTFNGEDYMYAMNLNVDNSFPYTVSYITRDRSPIASFVGTYATNEKTLLLDLVDSVQQASTRLSVVENKKAEKDAPAWMYPTLLNGWVPYSAGEVEYPSARCYKDSLNMVHIDGLISGGTLSPSLIVFILPAGFRPKKPITCVSVSSGGSGELISRVRINPNGEVVFSTGGNLFFSLAIQPFLAEQ